MRTIYVNTTSREHQKKPGSHKYDWHLKRAGTLVEDRAILLAIAEADERDQQEIHHCHSLKEIHTKKRPARDSPPLPFFGRKV